jgi:N-acetylmuramoyl-L-alanine amidase
MKRILLTIAIAMLAAWLFPVGTAADTTIEVVYDGDRPSERLSGIELSGDDDVLFLRANDVARLLRATQFWNASSRKIVLGVGHTRFVLTVDTRVVVVDGEPVMMRAPVRYDAGFVLVPLEFVLEIASQHTPRGFEWDPDQKRLAVRGIGFNVTRISFDTARDRTTATLHLTEPLVYHVDNGTPGLIRLKLYGGRIDLRAFSVGAARGLVSAVRAEQSERDAFVTIDISRDVRRMRVERVDSPPQLVIVLEKGGPADAGGVEVVEEGAGERAAFEIDRICIDAGHGGREVGKESRNGVYEKDVTLAIARVVRERIQEELGLEVVMTRDDDRMLGLRERTEIANASGSDLFISIHCNSWFNQQTGGFESYFLSPARSESERALARFENASAGGNDGEPHGDVEFILWDLVQNEYIAQSSTFAEYIQREMMSRLQLSSRGVKQANFVVLQGARMPAVLIETAFLSNPAEERMLVDPDFHRRVAEGIVASIRRMQERYR